MIDFQCKSRYNVDDFRKLVHRLRQKDGCPWDRVQTHHSIRDNFIEETYEACEAIDSENSELLKEELGDVLMQVLFHASIEEDAGRFDLDDIADGACKKLIFRHPNLFGGTSSDNWEELKQKEKGYTTQTQRLDAVARSLPALWRARKVQGRAKDAGFDWPEEDCSAPLAKADEEMAELHQALHGSGDVEEELGDLLFALVNLARHTGLDPEKALHKATDKFIRRFGAMETLTESPLKELSPEAYLDLWQKAKQIRSEES